MVPSAARTSNVVELGSDLNRPCQTVVYFNSGASNPMLASMANMVIALVYCMQML